jgi:hypothetical protein
MLNFIGLYFGPKAEKEEEGYPLNLGSQFATLEANVPSIY